MSWNRTSSAHSSLITHHLINLEKKMVDLIPSSDTVMQILKRTGAFREGHFVYPNGKHSPHYFQMPLAFRYYDTGARARGGAAAESFEWIAIFRVSCRRYP